MKFAFRSAVLSIGLLVAAFTSIGVAHAGFIGNNIAFELHYPGANGGIYGSQSGVISNGTVFGPIYYNYSTATFTDNTISFTDTPSPYTYDVFYDIIGVGLNIVGVTITGIDASRLTFDANSIFINVGGLLGNSFSVSVDFGQDVPEPASLALLGIGFAGLAAVRRRKQKLTA